MRSVESIVGTYLRNQKLYINRFFATSLWNTQIIWAVTEELCMKE